MARPRFLPVKPRGAIPVLVGILLAALAVPVAAPPARAGERQFEDGFYVGLGIGYAAVFGDRGVPMRYPGTPGCAPGPYLWTDEVGCVTADSQGEFAEVARSDFASGLTAELRLGYNFFGYASVEISAAGSGTVDTSEGLLFPVLQVRLHPIQFGIPHDQRFWDVSVFAGLGYTIGGYSPDERYRDSAASEAAKFDGKGWQGIVWTTGVGAAISPVPWFSVSLDLRVVLPQYWFWIVNFDTGVRSEPVDVPTTVIFAPTLQATFHIPGS